MVTIKQCFAVLSCLAALVLAPGCGDSGSLDDPADQEDVARSEKQRITSPQVAPDRLEQLVSDNTAFAMDLHQLLPRGGNAFHSPYSVSVALAMTYAGARGNTEREMADALHFGLSQADLHPAINALDLQLASRGEGAKGKDGNELRLNVVNAIWGQRGYEFVPEYLDRIAENYGAGLRLLNFVDQPEPSRQTINEWVEDQTEQRIKDLIPKGMIKSATRLVLTNAIYFNAAWKNPFDKDVTRDGPFNLLDGSQVKVPLMNQTEHLGHARGEGWQAVDLPYDGEELSLTVLLPDAGQFDQVERALTGEQLETVVDSLKTAKVNLTLPRFKVESKYMLREQLQALGIKDAFSYPIADFTGINTTRELFISEVIHQSFVELDEDGTEAAAATAVIMEAGAMPIEERVVEVKVDRPFLFLIRDRQTNAVLFVGRVVNPAA